MSSEKSAPKSGSSKLMHYGMIACCSVMLLPVAGFFIAGGTIAGLWSNISVFAPLALCLGAHVFMFKVMGKSCHSKENESETPEAAKIPKVGKSSLSTGVQSASRAEI